MDHNGQTCTLLSEGLPSPASKAGGDIAYFHAYDHVDPVAIDTGDVCAANMSRVNKSQRFVGVSRAGLFSTFGVWYESHPGR